MTDRARPHILLAVRIQVAERQVRAAGFAGILRLEPYPQASNAEKLEICLEFLFGETPYHLDHNPALILRPYNPRIKDPAARYTPNANDPDALIYRTTHAHHIKTNVIGDRGQLSDTTLRVKNRNIDRKRGLLPAKRKSKIPQRKTKWPSRPFSRSP